MTVAPVDAQRIRELLGRPEYARFFALVRRRLEEAGTEPALSVSVRSLDDEERAAVAGLMGLSRPPTSSVRLDRLGAALRESAVLAGLVEVLEALGGPLVDRRRLRGEAEAARLAMWERARSALPQGRPELREWLEELRSLGLVARAAGESGEKETLLLERALACACRLPASGVALAVMASEVSGDAHALDPGRPLAGLVLRAAMHLADWREVPTRAEDRRRLWAEVGVLCDPLSAQVLVHGLSALGEGRLARELRAAAGEGEPRRLTLRELQRGVVVLPSGALVSVCENPSVVAAAAERLGAECGPVVCVEGQPSTAALMLLRGLAAAGARLRFHADFDWSGIRIGNQLAALGAEPWRFSVGDYEGALKRASGALPLEGRPAEASWDPAIGDRMQRLGRAVFEEQVLEELLADLGEVERG